MGWYIGDIYSVPLLMECSDLAESSVREARFFLGDSPCSHSAAKASVQKSSINQGIPTGCKPERRTLGLWAKQQKIFPMKDIFKPNIKISHIMVSEFADRGKIQGLHVCSCNLKC